MNPIPRLAPGERSPQLDGLRGIAILMVFFHHSGLKVPHWWDWGQMGVRLFFVLTGYLITLSLWKIAAKAAAEGGGHWRELGIFHLRRLARLLPAFYLAIAFGVLIGLEDVIQPIWWHLGFLTHFKLAAQGYFFGSTAHFWSLALQEQFYVLWPLVVLFVPFRWFPLAMALVFACAYSYRVAFLSLDFSRYYLWVMLPGSLDSFAIGALIAWLKAGPGLPKLPSGRGSAAALFLIIAGCWMINRWMRVKEFGPFLDSLPEMFEGICAAYLLIGCLNGWTGIAGKTFSWEPLRYIGKISYGIFVYHLVLLFSFEQWLEPLGFGPQSHVELWSIGMLGLTILVAALSWRFVEQPISQWSRKFWDQKEALKAQKLNAPALE